MSSSSSNLVDRTRNQAKEVKENKKDATEEAVMSSSSSNLVDRTSNQAKEVKENKKDAATEEAVMSSFSSNLVDRTSNQAKEVKENKKDAATEKAVMSSSSSNLVDRTSNQVKEVKENKKDAGTEIAKKAKPKNESPNEASHLNRAPIMHKVEHILLMILEELKEVKTMAMTKATGGNACGDPKPASATGVNACGDPKPASTWWEPSTAGSMQQHEGLIFYLSLLVVFSEATLLMSPDTLAYCVGGVLLVVAVLAVLYFVCKSFRSFLGKYGISLTGTAENAAFLVRTRTIEHKNESNVSAAVSNVSAISNVSADSNVMPALE
ncbi:hypothetical protein DY000_02019466 [Brassica cretica]|nr:hypothetical protein DY000_02019466 [Brassica cretica]